MTSLSESESLGAAPESSAKSVDDIMVVTPGKRYRNKKTGNIYTVTELTCDSEEEEAGKMIRVIYRKEGDTRAWDRPAWLFVQKFEQVDR